MNSQHLHFLRTLQKGSKICSTHLPGKVKANSKQYNNVKVTRQKLTLAVQAGQNSGIQYDRQLQQLNMQSQAWTNATKAQNLTVQAIS